METARLRELNGGGAGKKTFLQSETVAADRIADAIGQRAQRFVFPWQLHLLARLFNCLPLRLQQLRRK